MNYDEYYKSNFMTDLKALISFVNFGYFGMAQSVLILEARYQIKEEQKLASEW